MRAMLSAVFLVLVALVNAEQAKNWNLAATCEPRGGSLTAVRNSTCYEFFNEEVTWVDARDRCRKYNAKLVSVTSDDLQRWLEAAVAKFLPGSVGVWIGLNDRREEGKYVWDDMGGNDQEAKFVNWHTGEPDDRLLGQDCVYMRKTYKWKWVDVECALTYRSYSFVCETEPRASTNDRTVEVQNTLLPVRLETADVSSTGAARNTQAADPNKASAIKTEELPATPLSAIEAFDNSESETSRYSLVFAIALALIALIVGALLTYFLVYRKPERLARLKAAAAITFGRRFEGVTTNGVESPAKKDADAKMHLLTEVEQQSSKQAVRQQSNATGSGGGRRAFPNEYVSFGVAPTALAAEPLSGGGCSEYGEPVYTALVEPLC